MDAKELVEKVNAGAMKVALLANTAERLDEMVAEVQAAALATYAGVQAHRRGQGRGGGRLIWPSGAECYLFCAEAPSEMQGKQYQEIWIDADVPRFMFEDALLGRRLAPRPEPELVATQHLAVIREAKTRVQLAQAQLELMQLRAFVSHGLGPNDVFDDATGIITRAQPVARAASHVLASGFAGLTPGVVTGAKGAVADRCPGMADPENGSGACVLPAGHEPGCRDADGHRWVSEWDPGARGCPLV